MCAGPKILNLQEVGGAGSSSFHSHYEGSMLWDAGRQNYHEVFNWWVLLLSPQTAARVTSSSKPTTIIIFSSSPQFQW